MATVLSPCLVNGETVLVEVDLDACPKLAPVAPCAWTVRYFCREDILHLGPTRFGDRPTSNSTVHLGSQGHAAGGLHSDS